MKTCITPDCNRQFIGGGHCRCHQCRKRLVASGLCCFCGDKPCAPPRAKYCHACLDRIVKLGAERRAAEPTKEIIPPRTPAKYRDSDARENLRETRRGRD